MSPCSPNEESSLLLFDILLYPEDGGEISLRKLVRVMSEKLVLSSQDIKRHLDRS
jgi:hypothetical protein